MAQFTLPPWQWYGNAKTRQIYLATPDRGRLIVMDFVRQGTHGATPRFRDANGLMRNALEFATTPDHNGNFTLTHPDALMMRAAGDLYEALMALREVVRDYILPAAKESGRQIPVADAVGIETVFEGADKALAKVRGEDD